VVDGLQNLVEKTYPTVVGVRVPSSCLAHPEITIFPWHPADSSGGDGVVLS
jgi:hypothetical protein